MYKPGTIVWFTAWETTPDYKGSLVIEDMSSGINIKVYDDGANETVEEYIDMKQNYKLVTNIFVEDE